MRNGFGEFYIEMRSSNLNASRAGCDVFHLIGSKYFLFILSWVQKCSKSPWLYSCMLCFWQTKKYLYNAIPISQFASVLQKNNELIIIISVYLNVVDVRRGRILEWNTVKDLCVRCERLQTFIRAKCTLNFLQSFSFSSRIACISKRCDWPRHCTEKNEKYRKNVQFVFHDEINFKQNYILHTINPCAENARQHFFVSYSIL